MNEFTRSLLYVALLVCVPIVTACIKKGITVAVDAINAQTQNIKVQRLVREIGDAVANAVAAMNQTYVNDLKTAGTFKEAEQKEALMKAVSAARSTFLRSLNRSRLISLLTPSLWLARRITNWKSVPVMRPGKPRCFSMTRPPDRRGGRWRAAPVRPALCDQLYLPVNTGSG